jgi:hypothetical protein
MGARQVKSLSFEERAMANEANFKAGQRSGVQATPQQIRNSAARQDHNAGAAKAQQQRQPQKKK